MKKRSVTIKNYDPDWVDADAIITRTAQQLFLDDINFKLRKDRRERRKREAHREANEYRTIHEA